MRDPILFSVLGIIIFGILAYVIFMYRNQIKNFFNKLMEKIKPKTKPEAKLEVKPTPINKVPSPKTHVIPS